MGWIGFSGLIFLDEYGCKKNIVVYSRLDRKEIFLEKNSCDGWKQGSEFFELTMRNSNLLFWVFFSPSGGGGEF